MINSKKFLLLNYNVLEYLIIKIMENAANFYYLKNKL
jgi:hypothetical protein